MKNNNLTNVSKSPVLSPEEMTGVKGGFILAVLSACTKACETKTTTSEKPKAAPCKNDAGTGYEWKDGEVVKCE